MSEKGHEHQFPLPRLSGRCGIRKRSFAGDGPGQLGFWGQALTGNDAGAFPGYLQSRPSPSRRASRATANLTTLVSFNDADGAHPAGGLIADAEGNLFGTTQQGGAHSDGTVFEIRKTRRGYAGTPTTLVSFCVLANCADGVEPVGLIADTTGNLFSTTESGGANGIHGGTVFEITDSGFVVAPVFAGTPGKANCDGQSVSALAKQYGGLNNAAAALGYSSVSALQNAIMGFCEG